MNIYELTAKQQELLDLAESGQFDEEVLQETLNSINETFDIKVEGYIKVINELKYTEEKLQSEIKRLQERTTSVKNNIDRMKEVVTDQMNVADRRKIKTDTFSIWVQNNPQKLVVEDESNIPSEYFEEQKPKLNKKALLDYLKAHEDEELEGVEVVQTESVRYK